MRLKAAHGHHFRVSRIVLLRVNDHALRAPHPEPGEHLCQPRLNDKTKIIQQEQRATTPQVGLQHRALAGPISGAWIGIDNHVARPGNVWLCGGEDGAHLKAERFEGTPQTSNAVAWHLHYLGRGVAVAMIVQPFQVGMEFEVVDGILVVSLYEAERHHALAYYALDANGNVVFIGAVHHQASALSLQHRRIIEAYPVGVCQTGLTVWINGTYMQPWIAPPQHGHQLLQPFAIRILRMV